MGSQFSHGHRYKGSPEVEKKLPEEEALSAFYCSWKGLTFFVASNSTQSIDGIDFALNEYAPKSKVSQVNM